MDYKLKLARRLWIEARETELFHTESVEFRINLAYSLLNNKDKKIEKKENRRLEIK